MKTAKLLICYHKPDVLLKDEIMTPIHVGRANAKKDMKPDDPKLKWLLENMIGDDTGDNISLLNRTYNELTALYWAWKNYDELGDPDYIGLMHYRRHFVFNEGEIKVYEIPDMESEHYFEALNYNPEKLIKDLEDCDFACHLGKVDGIYKHYLANHRIEDMELALEILKKKYPKYYSYSEEYMKQDVGNFCNMFIFPKEMFFEYCEYIFSILEEFRSRVDVSEKRFFISERLTGIFIYAKMQQGLKYKVYPINFVCEGINIPIAYPLTKTNAYAVSVSIASALQNADKTTSFTFYLMHGKDVDKGIKEKFSRLAEYYSDRKCSFEFIESLYEPEYYPLEISERLPKLNKLIYFNEKAIAMHDLSEFYRTCSVDDYLISGIPKTYAGNDSELRKLSDSIFVINCKFMRNHKILEKAKKLTSDYPGIQVINSLCENQIGYFAEWFVTLAGDKRLYDRAIRAKAKNRGQYQLEATWRPVLYFGQNEPWSNIQGIYSNFWWNCAVKTPMLFSFPYIDSDRSIKLLNEQQCELNHFEEINRGICRDDMRSVLLDPRYNPLTVGYEKQEAEESRYRDYINEISELCDHSYAQANRRNNDWVPEPPQEARYEPPVNGSEPPQEEKLSMPAKMKRYYRQFGMKRTVKRVFEKLGGK